MARGNQVPISSQATSSNNSGGRVSYEDSSRLFYLQNGDHPGLVLVSHLLTGNNYNTWSRAMSMALTAKDKLLFVDGTQLRPPSGDLLYAVWICCNNMVISWILNSVSREIVDSLLYISTAYEIWNDLRDRFHQSNAPRFFQIKNLLTGLHQGSMDISSYYTRMRTLFDELKDFQPIFVCHCGLIKEWLDYHNQECVMQFLMGLNESYAQIRAQILMMEPLPVISKTFSLVVQEESQRSIHHDASVTLPDQSLVFNTSNVAAIRGAPNIKGTNYSDVPLPTTGEESEGRVHVNHARSYSDVTPPKTGETLNPDHCRQLIAFLSSQLQLGDNNTLVSQCQPDTALFPVFNQDKMIGMDRRVGDLFGHASFPKLSILGKALDTNPINNNDILNCEIFPLSRQRRLPFISNSSLSNSPFDLIHIDVWGPFNPLSVDGFKYFLTIVDDQSRYTWIYLLKSKSDVLHIFPSYCRMIHTQFDKQIKQFDPKMLPNFGSLNFSNVTFHENVFPFQCEFSPSVDSNFFSDSVLPTQAPFSSHPLNDPAASSNNDVVACPHRVPNKPAWLTDYQCYAIASSPPTSTTHPLSYVLSNHKLSIPYQILVHNISSIVEPNTFSQAVVKPEWREAMDAELQALESNRTWSIVSLSHGKSVVEFRWVYKAKFRADGTL
ncbi:uncharacterized protein [Primulina eburnea]|uniref:uncharacterized protein n=1 Tax=Primulina eburnea TaxID=1245227 RepID=UPI003C6C1491